MTKKLAETFGFNDDDETINEYENNDEVIEHEDIDNIENSDIVVIQSPDDQINEDSGISEHEAEMNEIFSMAIDAHKKTMELGFGVEPKNSSPGLSSSTSFLNIALNASKSKVEKKLSLLRIKMEKNTDKNQKNISTNSTTDEIPQNQIAGEAMDRNDLMEELKLMIEKK